MWSVCDRFVVGLWSVCGRFAVGLWPVCGRFGSFVVGVWSDFKIKAQFLKLSFEFKN